MGHEQMTIEASPATKDWKNRRQITKDRGSDAAASAAVSSARTSDGCDEFLLPAASDSAATAAPWQRVLKRAEDLVIGSALLITFAPVMALIAMAIKLESAGPVIYRQRRHGQHGHPFWLYKFRSMYVDADETKHRVAAQEWIKSDKSMDGSRRQHKLNEDDRITRVGHWIRNTHLDELPQLWNVLCGDMSVVGPRPPVPYEYEEYAQSHHQRLLSKPGITGLWQVSGHHRVSFEEMVVLDVRYNAEWSLWMDLRIMAKTIPLLLFGRRA